METIWNPDLIDRLIALWDEGHPTAEIGRRLAISKNAVIGKAHRLALTPRPSPLKSPPVRRRTLGPQPAACTWPQGHPGDKDFRFCGERPVQGKPYCAKHAAMAYVRAKTHSAA
jgi:GcrA cell cycle regulator